MATRKIVPRADNEGGLGTTLKRWASAFIAAITCTTINALTLAAQAVGFTIAGGTTSKTLTVDETVAMSDKATQTTGSYTLTPNANLVLEASEAVATWVKTGKFVTVSWLGRISTVSGTNTVTFSLPFTAATAPANSLGRYVGVPAYEGVIVGDRGLICEILSTATTIGFRKLNNNATQTALTNSDLTAGDYLGFTISYISST